MRAVFYAVLVLAVIGAVTFFFLKDDARLPASVGDGAHDKDQLVSFAGGTLRLAEPWRKQTFGSRDDDLSMKKAHDRLAGSVDLVDIRRKPVNAARFTQGWQAAVGSPTFRPQSLAPFHDEAVDSSRMPCVEIHWSGDVAPLQIVCVTADGRWKLVLLGKSDDIAGLDMLARQMPAFERAL